MIYLRQSTAVDIMLGPFVDDTDGKTTEESLTLAQADLQLSKNGGTAAQKNDTSSATHRYGGNYKVDLNATDTNTLGHLRVMCKESGALPIIADFMVVTANWYDTMFSTDQLDVNVTNIEGSDATDQINAACDTALADYDAPTKAELDSGFAALNDLSTADVNAEVDTALADYDAPTKAELDAGFAALNDLSAAEVNAEVDTALADYDPPTKAELDSGFAGLNDLSAAEVNAEVDTALADYDAPTKAELDAGFAALNDISEAEVNAQVDTALADIHLDHLLAVDYDPASKPGTATALFNELIENDGGVSRFTANALEEAPSGGGGGDATEANQTTIIGHLTDIKGGTFSGATDSLEAIRDRGDAEWITADVSALATSAALATVDTNIDAILVDTDTTIPGLINGLNDLSAAEVNAQVDIALSDYDGPTRSEATSDKNEIITQVNANETKIDIIDGIVDDILVDTNELQTNQGDWATATGFATAVDLATVDANVDAILVDTDELQTNQSNWVTATGFATEAKQDIIDANVDDILVDTGTTIPGTLSGLATSAALAVVDSIVDDILVDTNELQTDDVPGLIAALNNLSEAQVNAQVDAALADYDGPTRAELTSDKDEIITQINANETKIDIIDGVVDDILVDTNELQTNQGNWATATGFATETKQDIIDSNVDAILVDTGTTIPDQITGLNDISAAEVNAQVDSALADYDGPTRAELTSDKDEIITQVNANEAKIDTIDGIVDAILVDTNELQINQGNWATATGFATETKQDIIDSNVDAILEDTGTTLPGTLTTIEGKIDTIDGVVDTILVDTNELQTDDIPGLISALESHGDTTWSTATGFATDTDLTAVKVTTDKLDDTLEDDVGTYRFTTNALEQAPGSDATSANQTTIINHLTDIKGGTFSGATDSLEAIRDRGDAAWTTGAGGSAPTVEEIRIEMDSNSTQLAAIVADTNELQTDDVPGLLSTISGKIDTIDGIVDMILLDTNELQTDDVPSLISALETHGDSTWATATGFATEAKQDIIDTVVDAILVDTGTTLPGTLTTIEGKLDTVDTVVDTILVDTNELQTDDIPGKLTALETHGDSTWSTATGFATETKQDIIDANIDLILEDTGTTLDVVVDSIKAVTDKLEDTLEDDLGTYRFTENSLEQAPSGGGGDATAANQTTIINHLTDVKGATFSGTTDSLEAIRNRGDAAWITGSGGTAPTVEEIRIEIDSNSTQLSTLVTRISEARAGYLDNLNVTGTLAHSDAADTYKANVASLATSTELTSNFSSLNDPTVEAIADAVLDEVLTDLSDNAVNIGESITLRKAARALFNRFFREVTQEVIDAASAKQVVKNDSDVQIAEMAISDDGTTQTKGTAT